MNRDTVEELRMSDSAESFDYISRLLRSKASAHILFSDAMVLSHCGSDASCPPPTLITILLSSGLILPTLSNLL